jgi:hypothetical protein
LKLFLVAVFGFRGVVGRVFDGPLKFANTFPEALPDLRETVGPEKKQADEKDDKKLGKSYAEHGGSGIFVKISERAL